MASTDARPVPQKNVAYRAVFPIMDADGYLVTGAAGLDSEISKDQGAFTDCTNEATEIATASGMYYLDLSATEMNADCVAIIVKTSTTGAKTTVLVMYPEEAGDIRVNVTQYGGVNGTFSGGRPEVNASHAAGTAWNSGAIGAATLATDAITAAKIAADAITAAKIATGAIDADAIADNAIDAGAIASGAITSAKFAADAITSTVIANNALTAAKFAAGAFDAVWTVTTRTLSNGAIAAATFAANAITSTVIADGALTAAKAAAGFFDAVWSVAARLLTAGTNIVLAKGTGVTGFNDLSAAQVNAEADAALADAGVTTTVTGRIDVAVSSRLAAGSYTAPDNAGIAAIKAKTDTLPASPAGVGDAMTLTAAYDFAKGTVAMAESYAANGAEPTPIQALYAIHQQQQSFAFAGAVRTTYKLDRVSVAFNCELDSTADPITSLLRAA